MESPKSLLEAIQVFSDEKVCIDAIASMRWPDGPVCPTCETGNPYYIKTQRRWKCRECRRQFSVKVGTLFEDSPISLTKWLPALWLLCNCKNGVSSYEISRDLKVTQKSAWFMLHRLRAALAGGSLMKMGGESNGPIEIDETFVGPLPQKMHRDKREARYKADCARPKVPVMGMLDRELRQVRAKVVPNVRRETLQNEILNQIEKGRTVYTDSAPAYDHLLLKGYMHQMVNHVQEYVRGEVHTQGIENFWSLLKRTLRGTYVAVEPFHLDRYVTEQVFRFNNRATKDNPLTDADRFTLAVSQIAGKRLTYAALTGKVPPSF